MIIKNNQKNDKFIQFNFNQFLNFIKDFYIKLNCKIFYEFKDTVC